MNCVVVDIIFGLGGKGGWVKKLEVFKVNIGNGCIMVERFDVEFFNLGDDVVRGGEGNFVSLVGDCGMVNWGVDLGVGEGSGNIQGGGIDSGNGGVNQNLDLLLVGDLFGFSIIDLIRLFQFNLGGKLIFFFIILLFFDFVFYC